MSDHQVASKWCTFLHEIINSILITLIIFTEEVHISGRYFQDFFVKNQSVRILTIFMNGQNNEKIFISTYAYALKQTLTRTPQILWLLIHMK